MNYDPTKHHRRSIRWKGYDYRSRGAYFVTICARDRMCLFGEVVEGRMIPNAAGTMIGETWLALANRFKSVELDAFVVMPNHFHGIVALGPPEGATLVVAPALDVGRATTRVAPTLGEVVGAFKSLTTVVYARGVKTKGWPGFRGTLWQRNYYEHVFTDEVALELIRAYIADNPMCWTLDRENPLAPSRRLLQPWHT